MLLLMYFLTKIHFKTIDGFSCLNFCLTNKELLKNLFSLFICFTRNVENIFFYFDFKHPFRCLNIELLYVLCVFEEKLIKKRRETEVCTEI